MKLTSMQKMIVAIALVAVVAIAAVSAATFLWTRQTVQRPVPSYARVTLRRGNVLTARFTPDGQSVLYSATWDGKPREVFSQRLRSTDARTLGLTGSRVMAAAEPNQRAPNRWAERRENVPSTISSVK